MITIKDFSPITDSDILYWLNDPNFKGTELFFSSSDAFLYAMQLRRRNTNFDRCDIVNYSRMVGKFNGVDYDYRIDYDHYIKIYHPDLVLQDWSGVSYADVDFASAASFNFLLINPTDFESTIADYIYTETNEDSYILYYDLNSFSIISEVQLWKECVFYDYDTYADPITWDSEVYQNSLFLLNTAAADINYVKMYDKNDVLVADYNFTINDRPDYVRSVFYPVVANTHKIVFSYTYSLPVVTTIYVNGVCNKQQYFYYGTVNRIGGFCCTAKRNKVKFLINQEVRFGRYAKNINKYIQDKYTQNTGFNITEDKLFELAKSPYVFEISGTTIKQYTIDETDFDGNNTKTFENRNRILNLTSRTLNERYTGFLTTFFT